MPIPYQIFAGPGSPYSHKVRSVFRHRRIPHIWTIPQGEFTGGGTLGSDQGSDIKTELQKANKGVVPVVKYPDGSYKADSTPIIYEMEELHTGRSVIPPHPGIAFLSHLIEDMADEFLPMPMFFYRWTDDQIWCSRRQMVGWIGAIDDQTLDNAAQLFLDRQFTQLSSALSSLDPAQMKSAYGKFLSVMENQLKHSLFLFGTRPSIAEFAIYGQLTQYAVDPKVCNWMKKDAVRTYQWTHHVDDLSGMGGEWFEPDKVFTQDLMAFLQYTAEFYIPMAEFLTQMLGVDGLGGGANGMKYRVRTFLGLKAELAELDPADRDTIRPILEDAGCWEPLQFKDGEADNVVPILPV